MNSINIRFENLTYCIQGQKIILNDVRGKFPAGKLTGILGPSGAGKSTLLNILAGLVYDGVSGNIFVNNTPRDNKTFHKLSSYITQDDTIQTYLTVGECMLIAAHLKFSTNISIAQKKETIDALLKSMCLAHCAETKTQHLSGGERKRLNVALELVNNPPVIFLDEPTTGLDEVTLLSCMKLFKKLSIDGRTVICTIHQPSDNVFSLFDHVYFLSEGKCVYEGNTTDIIPFLDEINLLCPITYNPADYIIELVHENDETAALLCNQTKIWINRHENDLALNENHVFIFHDTNLAPFWCQVSILIKRRLLQHIRNKVHLSIEIGHNIVTGLWIGLIFYKMGNNASSLINNLFIIYAVNMYIIFVHTMAMILLCPFEVKVFQREYMNRWYNLKAYFLAFNISNFPFLCIGSIILSLIIYYMTGQPTDKVYRIYWFNMTTILYALTAQGLGVCVGVVLQPTTGACVGSAVGISLILLSVCNMGNGMYITQIMKIIMSLSFVYHSFVAYLVSIFRSRNPADCNEEFCYYSNPDDMLKIMGINENDYFPSILYLCAFLVLHRVIAYMILKARVNPNTKLYKILH